jgi:hypothetical protein
MSRKAMLGIAAAVLAVCLGITFGFVAGFLSLTGKKTVAVSPIAAPAAYEAVAPSDNVFDWKAEPAIPTPARPVSDRTRGK